MMREPRTAACERGPMTVAPSDRTSTLFSVPCLRFVGGVGHHAHFVEDTGARRRIGMLCSGVKSSGIPAFVEREYPRGSEKTIIVNVVGERKGRGGIPCVVDGNAHLLALCMAVEGLTLARLVELSGRSDIVRIWHDGWEGGFRSDGALRHLRSRRGGPAPHPRCPPVGRPLQKSARTNAGHSFDHRLFEPPVLVARPWADSWGDRPGTVRNPRNGGYPHAGGSRPITGPADPNPPYPYCAGSALPPSATTVGPTARAIMSR